MVHSEPLPASELGAFAEVDAHLVRLLRPSRSVTRAQLMLARNFAEAKLMHPKDSAVLDLSAMASMVENSRVSRSGRRLRKPMRLNGGAASDSSDLESANRGR